MNRAILTVAGVFSASSLLLVDSAVKGMVLLVLAAVAALILRRDSAATRHLVWVLAMVAILVVPVLSATLPQWRVLPAWVSSPRPAVVDASSTSIAWTASGEMESPRLAKPAEVGRPSTAGFPPAAVQSDSQPAPMLPGAVPTPAVWTWNWIKALPYVWASGFSVLMLRLSAARWMLWNSEQSATVVGRRVAPQLAFESRNDSAARLDKAAPAIHDPIVTALEAICSQLGIGRPVILLIHPAKTIPVVWGILRCRLLLPAAARDWSAAQLRSVLLHELAHVKRGDATAQLLTQIACALHWFNPLVWFGAWQLGVERERACDDLVLASGVRPSAYAGHLLEVVRELSPAPWTQACGLAMARKSSLEGRLVAVLGQNLNRRDVPLAIAAIALMVAIVIAIPIAMLRAADEVVPAGNVTGKLAPEAIAKLKWGEPVNGLRMAPAWPPALGDALLGTEPYFQLVVQNVSEEEVHFIASDAAPNPRKMLIREGERIVQAFSDPELSAADWKLQPGQCGVLRLFTQEERDKNGTTLSSAIESDLSKIGRYHAIVRMEIAKAPAGAWTGKLVTGQTRGSADVAAAPAPMHKDARELYEIWQRNARANGDIPGALVGELASGVKQFIKYNPTWETVPKLNEILPRLDVTHDWKSADAIALLDEVAAVKDSPLSMAMWRGTRHMIRQGEALPKKFADAEWNGAHPSGLRVAWMLEPGAAEYRIGTALTARLLVWNSGAVAVVLQVPTFHQGAVKARDAKGADVEVSAISWLTLAESIPVRLAPGEYVEINTPGVGLGPRAGMEPWAGPRVGSNVLAKPGDDITLTHSPVPLDGSEVGMREDDPHVVGAGWWLAHIKTRLARELPLPADAAKRAHLLDRAVRELFAAAPTAEETAAFTADQTPGALDALANRLAARADAVEFSGKLDTAPAKFRVLAADANADQLPRVVLGPGEYPVGAAATLKIVGRPVGERVVNDTKIIFEPTEATGKLPPPAHQLEVPDGWGTWAIVCRPNEGFFYVLHQGGARKIDYREPLKVTDTPATDLPAEFRDEVKRQFDLHEVSAESQADVFEEPAPPAATPAAPDDGNAASPIRARDAWSAELLSLSKTVAQSRGMAEAKADDVIAWGEEQGGLRSGLLMPAKAKLGEEVTPLLVLKNVSGATMDMHVCTSLNVLQPTVHSADGKTFIETLKIRLLGADALYPVTLKAGEHIEFAGPPVLLGVGRGADGKPLTPDWPVAGVVMGAETVRVKFHLGNVRGPETGEVTVEVTVPEDQADENTRQPRVRKRGDWSADFLTHCKTVAEARGLKEWQPDDVVAWGPDGNGLRSGLVMGPRVAPGGRLSSWLVIRNFSKVQKELRLVWSWNATQVVARDENGEPLAVTNLLLFGVDAVFPITLKPDEQVEMPGPPVEFGGATGQLAGPGAASSTGEGLACRVDVAAGQALVKFDLTNLPAPETGEVAITVGDDKAAEPEAGPKPS